MNFLLYFTETLLGPPAWYTSVPGQAYWHCPFHDDASPSFRTLPHNPAYKDYWRCDGCARFGDVYNLLRLLRELGHPLARGGFDDHQWMVARWRAEYDAAAGGSPLNGGKETTPPAAAPACPGSRRRTRFAGDVSSSPLSRGCNVGQCRAYARALHDTTDADLTPLTELRGVRGFATHTCRRHWVAWDRAGGCWLIPHRGEDGVLVSLLRYYPDGRKLWVRGTPQALYGVDRLAADRAGVTLFVVEGPLDAIAVDAQLLRGKVRRRYDVLAVPGARNFKPEWTRHLDGYAAVRLCLDNDDSGREGQDRIAALAREGRVGSPLYALHWPAGTPHKYDVGDLVRDGVGVINFTRDHCAAVRNGRCRARPKPGRGPRP